MIQRNYATKHRNVARERCLVCCPKPLFTPEHAEFLSSLGYEVKVVGSAADTLRSFLDTKPGIFIAHRAFLPPSPHRLAQLFRIAGRTPAVLVMAGDVKQTRGYLNMKRDACIEFLSTPLSTEELALGVKLAAARLKTKRRRLFYNDLLTQAAFALPVFAFLAYLLMKGA